MASANAPSDDAPTKSSRRPSLREQIRRFGRPFWMANLMELLERLAYYGVRVVIPIYIASTEDPAGLHFSNVQKGTIFFWWAMVQSLLPMFTGGFADRYGNKPTIAFAIALKVAGYLTMATQRQFGPFLAGCLLLAAGTAIFKPGVQGTLLRGIDEKNSSVGWGIFYQCVNIGGFLGPPLAGYLHRLSWPHVFFSCAIIVSLNYGMLFTYKEPPRPEPSEGEPGSRPSSKSDPRKKSPIDVLVDSVVNIFSPRLLTFLVIMSGFWLMFMQLFDMLPNFIEEWTDTTSLVRALGLREGLIVHRTPRGLQISQEWMINLNAGLIIFTMVFVAALTARVRRLTSMFVGIVIASFGLVFAGFTRSGALTLAGIFVFSFGEMAASPKMNEYLGVIAPKGKEGLYMGYANVPVAIGWGYGSFRGGIAYDELADKANLALRWLQSHGVSMRVPNVVVGDGGAAANESIRGYLNDHGMGAVARFVSELHLPSGAAANAAVGRFLRLHAMDQMQATAHLTATDATNLLWETYHPFRVWYGFAGIGIGAAVAMVIYSRFARRWAADK